MSVRNIFSPVASRISRALLVNRDKDWSVLALSTETETGYGHAHRVVNTLIRMGLCRRTDANRIRLTNPGGLLTRWANYYDFASFNNIHPYYSLHENLDRLLRKLTSRRRPASKHALTLHAAAALLSPHVRPVSVHLYVESEKLAQWQRFLDLELSEMGGNVFLVEPYDQGVFYGIQHRNGIAIASSIQLYVDLFNYPARGREAADHLRSEVIEF